MAVSSSFFLSTSACVAFSRNLSTLAGHEVSISWASPLCTGASLWSPSTFQKSLSSCHTVVPTWNSDRMVAQCPCLGSFALSGQQQVSVRWTLCLNLSHAASMILVRCWAEAAHSVDAVFVNVARTPALSGLLKMACDTCDFRAEAKAFEFGRTYACGAGRSTLGWD